MNEEDRDPAPPTAELRAELIGRLAAFPDRAAVAAGAVVASGRAIPPGEWSPREVVLHLAAVEDGIWLSRLAELAADTHPRWTWTEPRLWSGPGDDTLDGAVAALRERRTRFVGRLEQLAPASWAHRGHHARYGELDVAGLIRIALDHDEDHLAQIVG